MHWNYRVMELKDVEGETFFNLAEVYYEDDGSLMGYVDKAEPFLFYGDEGDDKARAEYYEGLLENLKKAIEKPVLRPIDFRGNKE